MRDLDSLISSLGFWCLQCSSNVLELMWGSKTLNMVGGGGINSPHPPTSRYQQSSAHGRTGQSGAPPVRQRSFPTASSDR
jgi:hypothetical protein